MTQDFIMSCLIGVSLLLLVLVMALDETADED